ncbi:DUF86 domain-containing protein [Peptococcaceae bacterium]|nr:DUF86 domain-containing protein [Peptococcaceae bacterium]MCL0043782.1 DUF86 domain-containing protein [Peptococcaceae bacterium]MCL0052696.1 DUF86 domain-containing protein [Peptococcaceae bacterium]MCL0063440.1 DUF86 domain-containing protein [Peptococcaceae bacterium]
MPIDKLTIKQRLALIENCVKELEQLSKIPAHEFVHTRNAAAAESFLRRTLEAIFDIGRHILAKNGNINIALEYKGIAIGLKNMGIIDTSLSSQLIKMAGYRNRLVHFYHQVSDEELYSIINNNLKDIITFKEQIKRYLKSVNT